MTGLESWQLGQLGTAELRVPWHALDLFPARPAPTSWREGMEAALVRLHRYSRQPALQLALALYQPKCSRLAAELDPTDLGPASLRKAGQLAGALLDLASPSRLASALPVDTSGPRTQLQLTARQQFRVQLRSVVLECLRAQAQNQLLSGPLNDFQVHSGPVADARLQAALAAGGPADWICVETVVATLSGLAELDTLTARGEVRQGLLDQALVTGLEAKAEPIPGLAGLLARMRPHRALKGMVERGVELAALLEGDWRAETLLRADLESECRARVAEMLPGWTPEPCLTVSAHRSSLSARMAPRPLAGWLEALSSCMPFLAPQRPGEREPGDHEHTDSRWQQLLLERVLQARDRGLAEVRLVPDELRGLWRQARSPARASDRRLLARLAIWPVAAGNREPLAELLSLRFSGMDRRPPRQPGAEAGPASLVGLRQSVVLRSMRSLPRIRIGTLVLERARWQIAAAEAGEFDAVGDPLLTWQALRAWRLQRGVPRRVCTGWGESEVELDLDCPLGALLLQLQLAAHSTLVVYETQGGSELSGAEAPVTEAGRALRHELWLPLGIHGAHRSWVMPTAETENQLLNQAPA